MLIKHAHKVKIKKSLRILIIILLPIVLGILIYIFFFLDKTDKLGAGNVTDTFEDSTYIDLANSSNYLIDSGQLSVSTAGSFGTGNDGSVTIGADTNINTANSIAGRSCADGGDAVNYSVTSLTSDTATVSTGAISSGCIVAGDEVLLINLAGTTSSIVNLGNYEVLTVESVDNALGIVTFTSSKTKYYGENSNDDTNLGTANETQRVMLQRVPNYTNLTVSEGFTFYPTSWDGSKGGVIFFKVSDTATIAGTVSAEGKGYRGGTIRGYLLGGHPGEGAALLSTTNGQGGDGAEPGSNGVAGLWSGGGGAGKYVTTGYRVGGSGSTNPASSGGGGGGGSSRYSSLVKGDGGGGGGAGHATPGYGGTNNGVGTGTNGSDSASGTGGTAAGGSSTKNYAGSGGGGSSMYGESSLSILTMGGGGGAGGDGEPRTGGDKPGTNGGNGGGIVYVSANTIVVTGNLLADGLGSNPLSGTTGSGGTGGGGAGGSVKIYGNTVSLESGVVDASGGIAGTSTGGTGGNGGDGYIAIEYISSISGTTLPTATETQLSAYADTATIQSVDLINEEYDVQIMSFVYNLSAKPSGTGATVQFSTDSLNWYSSAGVLGASDSLGTGTNNSIDLSGLDWQTQTFYYKIEFDTNSGAATPVLDDITLGYDANPTAPTIGTPEALSTTSIRWNFTDNAGNENGFKLYDGGDSLVLTENTQNLSYIDETDLSPNTQYTRKVSAFNDLGNSDLSGSSSIYTLAEEPTISIGDLDITAVTLEAGNTNNLTSGSSGLFFDCTGDTCDTGINEWIQTTTDTVTNLSANTQYSFKVKARNGNSVETLNSSNILTYTLADIPTLTVSEVGTNSVSLSAGNTSNISDDSSGIFFDCTGDSCDTGINDWTQNAYDIAESLTENTQYTFQVKARNGDGTETSYSSTESVYTLLDTPSILSGSVGTNQIEITASSVPNRGAGSTGLYFDCVSDGCDTGINEWIDSSTTVSSSLNNNEMYEYRVKGRNADGIETGYSDTETFYTLAAVPVLSVTSVTTGSVSLSAEGVNNLSVGSTGIHFDCTGENCDTGINEWIRDTVDTATGLSANTQYTFVSKARSRNGIETSSSNMVSTYTLANKPNTPVLINRTSNSLTIKVDTNGNSLNTTYAIKETTTGKYLDPSTGSLTSSEVWSTYSTLGGSEGVVVTGLVSGQVYTFEIKARNGNSIETLYSSPMSATTLLTGPIVASATSLSTTSIRWNFTDKDSNESGFRIVDSSGKVQSTCSSPNISFCDETGLVPGSAYTRKILSFNSSLTSPLSSSIVGYTLSNTPGAPRVSSSDTSSVNVRIDTNGNGSSTRYAIQETQTNLYINVSDGTLVSSPSWGSYAEWGSSLGKDIAGLNPNETYIFAVIAENGKEVTTEYSTSSSATTFANPPSDVENSEVSVTSIKVTFSTNSNPSDTEYVIQDEISGMFVNPVTRNLVSSEVWGTYSVFGGENGITVGGLDPASSYSFRVKARNADRVETSYSPGSGNTVIGARIVNVPLGLKVVLSSNQNISVDTDEGRQSGTKNVRVKASNYIVADIPVSFTSDRDWSGIVLSMNAAEYKTVIKVSEEEGLADKFIMYVVSGDTDSFRLCPGAKTLNDVKADCDGEVLFNGNFPMTKEVEGSNVTVSKAQLDGVMYWIVDGLSGTGGQGFLASAVENEKETQEEETSVINVITTQVLGNLGENLKTVTEKATEAIDKTVVGDLEEGELQTVAATTSVVTVTVGASIAVGGFSEFLYMIMQVINSFFSWLGFRKKKAQYGYVYNSYTKEPISGVVVRIYEADGDLIDTFVTDSKGVFVGNMKPGIYRAKIKKKGYTFPSELIKGKNDLPMQNVYHGDDFILSKDDFVKLSIPLDPNSLAKGNKGKVKFVNILGNIFSLLNIILFVGGIGLSIYMYIKYPTTENILIGLIYLPALYALIVSQFGISKKSGVVKDTKGRKMKDVEVVVKETEFDQVVAKRITDEKGRYRVVLPSGKYRIEVSHKGYTIDKVKKGSYIEGKKEVVVNKKIVLKKK